MQFQPPKVVLIGHMLSTPSIIFPTQMERWGYNYNRVMLENGSMVDHLAWLKEDLAIPPEKDFTVWEIYLNSVLILKTRLEEAGVEVLVINYIDDRNQARIFEQIKNFAPELICLGTTFILSPAQLNHVTKALRQSFPDTFMVAGGQHVYTTFLRINEKQQISYFKATKLNALIFDSQGENSLLQLVKEFNGDLSKVANLIYKNANDEICITERCPENNDLNKHISLSNVPSGSVVHLHSGRGCNFKCAFCSYPITGGKRELMEIESVLSYIREARERGVSSIIFSDDTFNVPQERFETLLDRMIETGLTIPWYSFLRCQFVDAKLVKKMQKSGCRGVFLGIESGSNEVLANIGKGATVEHYRQGIKWLKGEGITTVGSFIIGFPGETQETLSLTEDFIATTELDYYFMQLFYYLHHAPIFNDAAKYDLKGNGIMWSHSTMDYKQASAGMEQIYMRAKTTVVNQDYNLWEIAYLESKGFNHTQIKEYRAKIREMTIAQMSLPT